MAVDLTTIPPQSGELARMLVEVGDGGAVPPNRNWLRSSTSVGSLTGDAEISTGLGLVDRVLWHQSLQLRIFRNGSDSLTAAIAAGGELAGKSFMVAVSETEPALRFDVDGATVTAVPSYVRLLPDAAGQAVFNAVQTGDLVNIVIADAPIAPVVDVDTAGDFEAGAPALAAAVVVVPAAGTPVHDTAGAFTAGAPGVDAVAVSVPVAAPADTAGDFDRGRSCDRRRYGGCRPGTGPPPSATNVQTARLVCRGVVPTVEPTARCDGDGDHV